MLIEDLRKLVAEWRTEMEEEPALVRQLHKDGRADEEAIDYADAGADETQHHVEELEQIIRRYQIDRRQAPVPPTPPERHLLRRP